MQWAMASDQLGGSGGLVQTHAEPVGGRQQVQRFSFDIAPISRYKFSLLAVTSECDACLCQGSLIVPPRRQPGDRVRSNNVLLEFAEVAARLDDLRRRLSLPVDYGRLPAGNNFDDLMKWNITRCYCWRARVSFNLACTMPLDQHWKSGTIGIEQILAFSDSRYEVVSSG